MIRINKTLDELDFLAKSHFATVTATPFILNTKLLTKLHGGLPPLERSFYDAIQQNLREIITARPLRLEALKNQIFPLYQAVLNFRANGAAGVVLRQIRKTLNAEVFELFNYNQFANGRFAYDLAQRLNVDVCLYCNRQYTFTLDTRNGKTRPQFDHFYDKGSHPYLALSFYNLIPSCSICNASLKGSETFTLTNNFHPYVDESEGTLSFRINITAIDFIDGKKDKFQITLKPSNSGVSPTEFIRAKNNAEVFKIEALSNMHKDYVTELIKKAYYYNEDKINQLSNFRTKSNNRLFDSKEEVIEFIVGNYVRQEKLGRRVLAKLTKDIAEQLGLLKLIQI